MQRAVVPSWLSYLNKTSWFICISVKIRCIMQLLACVGYWDNVVEIPFKTMMLQIVPFIVLSGPLSTLFGISFKLWVEYMLLCVQTKFWHRRLWKCSGNVTMHLPPIWCHFHPSVHVNCSNNISFNKKGIRMKLPYDLYGPTNMNRDTFISDRANKVCT